MPDLKILENQIYYYGIALKIVWAKTKNGSTPGRDFFYSVPEKEWPKLDRILKRLGDRGSIVNKEQFRGIDDALYEVKADKYRLVGYYKPNYFIITNGFSKRGGGKSANKVQKSDRDRAIRIRDEFNNLVKF